MANRKAQLKAQGGRHSTPSLFTTVEVIAHSGLGLSYQRSGRRLETLPRDIYLR